MSFRITRVLPVLGLFALLASPAAAQKAKPAKGEPTYDNRPLSAWIEDLSGLAPYTRHSAAYAIADIGPKATAAVPALIKNLEDPEATVRYSSALALGEIGPGAKEAVDPLKKLLEDRNEDVAAMARKSIKKISGEVVE
jgi:HEAT repeat protein